MTDRSSGYERISAQFLSRRGAGRNVGIGVEEVRRWAKSLPRGASVVDVGCGPGFPITEVLVSEGHNVYGIDGSPAFVEVFRRNLPGVPIVCESVQESSFYGRTFDAVLAWGLVFLLTEEDQRRLIRKFGELVVSGGRLLFTAPAPPHVWNDAMTGLKSVSLGAEEYRRELAQAGLSTVAEYEDEGQNHYFDAVKD